jgi:hypothetical protein
MPFLVGCLAVLSPRIALFFVWLFGNDYFTRAMGHWIFPVLGFFFLPLTTLAFAFGMNTLGAPNEMEPLGWLLTALAVIVDLGLAKKGHSDYRKGRKRDD